MTGGDSLGNHIATQKLDLGANLLVGNGGLAGIAIDNSGKVGIGTNAPISMLHINGDIKLNNANHIASCDCSTAGTIKFDGTNFQGCNGIFWVQLNN